MFNFENWSDIFLEHYVYSVIISLLIVIATVLITKFKRTKHVTKTPDPAHSFEDPDSKVLPEKNTSPIVSSLKKHPAVAAEKVIEASLTEDQKQREHEVRQKQLSQIYELMQKQTEKFGDISLSEIQEQFKLYQ